MEIRAGSLSGRRFAAALYHDCSGRISGHTTRAPPVGFKLETNGFQLYAIANLDKKSLSAASDTGYGPGET